MHVPALARFAVGEVGAVIHDDICNETNTLKEQVIQVRSAEVKERIIY